MVNQFKFLLSCFDKKTYWITEKSDGQKFVITFDWDGWTLPSPCAIGLC
jgi:hypothetical protein